MALIKCHECGKDVSTSATACPNCGSPPAAPETAKVEQSPSIIGAIILIAIMAGAVAMCSSDGDKKSKPKAASANCAKDDLQCMGERGLSTAHVYCKDKVERLAKNSIKWTDEGMFELKFSRFNWQDKPAGIIRYFGDRAQFQNGFGAYVNVVYACDVDVPKDKALRADLVMEGFLPE